MATTETIPTVLSRINEETNRMTGIWQRLQGQFTQMTDIAGRLDSIMGKLVQPTWEENQALSTGSAFLADEATSAGDSAQPPESDTGDSNQAEVTGRIDTTTQGIETLADKISKTTDKAYNMFRKSDLITGKLRIFLYQVSQTTSKISDQIASLTNTIEEAIQAKKSKITEVGVLVKLPTNGIGGSSETNIINNYAVNLTGISNNSSGDSPAQPGNPSGDGAGQNNKTVHELKLTLENILTISGQFQLTIQQITEKSITLHKTLETISQTTLTLQAQLQAIVAISSQQETTIRNITEVTTSLTTHVETLLQITASAYLGIGVLIQSIHEAALSLSASLTLASEVIVKIETGFHGVSAAAAGLLVHLSAIDELLPGIETGLATLDQTSINFVNSWQQIIAVSQNINTEINNITQATNLFQQNLTQVNLTVENLQIGIGQVAQTSGQLEDTLSQVSAMTSHVNSAMDELTQTSGKVSESLNQIGTVCNQIQSGVQNINEVTALARGSFELMTGTIEKLNQRIDSMQSVSGTAAQQMNQMGDTVKKTEEKSSSLGTTFSKMKDKVLSSITDMMSPMKLLNTAISKAGEFLKGSGTVWKAQVEVQGNLTKSMSGSMNADETEVNSILQLTAAQEKLGVVSRNVQTAGAAELAGHLTKSETLEQLLPSMNNLIAKQHGLNATQENASAMAGLMAQALDGEIAGLESCGIQFTDYQKKILQTGTETQRAAILAEAMEASIGGVNESLANTPEGMFKNHANSMEALQGRIGSLYEQVMVALMPLFDKISQGLDGVISLFEKHSDKIMKGVTTIANICGQAFSIVINIIDGVLSIFSSWFDSLEEGNGWVIALTGAIGIMGTILAAAGIQAAALATYAWACSAATTAWTAIQGVFNAVMALNPITWVILAIAGLIAAIVAVSKKTEGWGTLWDGVVGFMKHTFLAYVSLIKFQFTSMVDAIMIGLNTIRLGWYKFKEACGIGDSSENQAAIREINSEIEARQRSIVDGARQIMEHAQAAKDSLAGINITLKKDVSEENEESEESVAEHLTKSSNVITHAVEMPEVPVSTPGSKKEKQKGLSESNGNRATSIHNEYGGNQSSSVAESTVSTINSAGSQSRSIIINLGSMVENLIFNGEFEANREEVEQNLEDALLNVLQMAYTAQ